MTRSAGPDLSIPDAAPNTEAELRDRANRLAGHTLGEVANALNIDIPSDLRRNKGWVGNLLETCLGADAGNRAEPDFTELDIELKTLPVDASGRPLESTYVTTVQLDEFDEPSFDTSPVAHKLARVLWVPIHAEVELAHRMIGHAILWSPNVEEIARLRADWEWHMQVIMEGYVETIDGTDGDVLQIRPKASDSSQKTWGVDPHGNAMLTLPRGYYLRRSFTEAIVKSRLA